MDFWDVNRKKVMGSTSSHCAVAYGWSPDSRWFLTATCAPRMNVDNDVKVGLLSCRAVSRQASAFLAHAQGGTEKA